MTTTSMTEATATILLVDDSSDNLRVLSTTLMDAGYQVRCVKSGAMALMAVQAVLPDVILLDIRMPGLDGYEVCQLLKENSATAEIPIIFLSALDEALDKIKAFKVGGADYITKPFYVEEVLARVNHQLRLRRLQQQLYEQNQQLQQSQQMAEQANQVKSDFLVRMSHELRTPLSAMLGYGHLLRQQPNLSPMVQEGLHVIARSGEHLLTLINDVVEMSAIETGRVSLKPCVFDLPDLLQSLEDMFQLQAESKGIRVLWEQVSELPRYIRVDQQKLRQVLINLLSNAIKFTSSGQVMVRVARDRLWLIGDESAKDELTGQTWLQFSVEDTGIGMTPSELETVWQPFVQAEAGRQLQEGLGLGLAISHQVVKLMGGTMRIQSQLGQGTIVQFELPVQVSQAGDLAEISRFPDGQCRLAEPTDLRLLVVDDRWTNRRLMVRLLTEWGFSVREAENGLEAIDVWDRWQPHLIWMDVRMPGLDGIEATKRIKAHPHGKRTVIIAMTASAFEEEHAIMLNSGCDGFVQKPFHEASLRNQLVRHLGVQFVCESQATPPIDSISPSA